MKRVMLGALIGAAVFVLMLRPAQATVEFCPTAMKYERVGPESAKDLPSALYGFELTAFGARTITSARLAFDTSAGWYTVGLPATVITEKDRHYDGSARFVRHDYVSPVMYVRFPEELTIAHAWLYSAAAQNDTYGWQGRGIITCDPPPASSPKQLQRLPKRRIQPPYYLDPKDEDRLSDAPSATSAVFVPSSTKPLEASNCDEPFRDATVKVQAQPQYPKLMLDFATGQATTSVQVLIGGDGTLADAFVWGTSGLRPFDDAALEAAEKSTYEGALSYCKPVPASYFFRVTFDPN
jgi:hypothetical protein